MRANPHLRFRDLIAFVIFAFAVPVLAFDYPLSDSVIRDAYFQGKLPPDKWQDFMAPYAHELPSPPSGPDVAEIGIETPFLQIAKHARKTQNYYAPDAAQEFAGKRMELIVHVDVFVTGTYAPADVPGFWRDFKVQLVQGDEVPAETADASALSPPCEAGTETCFPDGARIRLLYDASKIDSSPVTVHVITPDGQDVQTTFDLGSLR